MVVRRLPRRVLNPLSDCSNRSSSFTDSWTHTQLIQNNCLKGIASADTFILIVYIKMQVDQEQCFQAPAVRCPLMLSTEEHSMFIGEFV